MRTQTMVNVVFSYYDDCAGDPTCPPTEDQISFFIGIGVILFVGFWVVAFLFYGFDRTRARVRKTRWDGRVHSNSAACGAKTIEFSGGQDVTKDVASITCSACLSALKAMGWDGLVHAQAFHTYYESLCGLKEPDYSVGSKIKYNIDWVVDVVDRPSQYGPGDRSKNRQRVTCPQCVDLMKK